MRIVPRYLTITARLTLWYLAVFGGIIITVAVSMYSAFATNERRAVDNELEDYAEFLMSQVNVRGLSISEIFDELEDVTTRANLRFRSMRFFLSNRDSVVYENSPQAAAVDPLIDSLQANVPRQNRRTLFNTISFDGTDFRTYTYHVPEGVSQGTSLIVVASLNRLNGTLSRLREILFVIVPLSLIAAGAGGWFIARQALSPVAELTETAAAISSSNLHRRVSGGGSGDELARLASTFNDMIARLERTFNSQRRFIADASHDLRTPLTVIRAELELMRSRVSEEERASLDRAIRGIDNLHRLANDLLLLARADADQLQPDEEEARLDEIVVECASGVMALASRRHISLRLDVSEPLEIRCSSSLLGRAITNVLENAIKYSPEGSSAEVSVVRAGDNARVIVADDGPGIPEEDLPRVLDRFYRGDRARSTQGTGLGLAITKAIIDAHHGVLAIESEPGRGTRVTIDLPIEAAPIED
jgi:heavy metal sensor kinase